MNAAWLYTLVSVFGVSAISFVGLFTFGMRAEHVRTILIYFISFAAGALCRGRLDKGAEDEKRQAVERDNYAER